MHGVRETEGTKVNHRWTRMNTDGMKKTLQKETKGRKKMNRRKARENGEKRAES